MTRRAALALALAFSWPTTADARGFEGPWVTTFGDMTLSASSDAVRGTYAMGGMLCDIEGRQKGDTLTFNYREPNASGEGWFQLSGDGESFEGQWRERGAPAWQPWKGRRPGSERALEGFAGLWNTSFGFMRLVDQSDGRLAGLYSYAQGSLEGRVEGRLFRFQYRDSASGEGEFTLSDDGRSLRGRWRAKGQQDWSDWSGARVVPVSGRRWLVIIEARWEESLRETEYSYGEMLKSFFTRAPHVQVRHRFFTDRASLSKWLREASFLAEPTIVYLSSHGSRKGLAADDGPADAALIAQALRYAPSVQLLHFGACDVMKGQVPAEIHRRLGADARFPISGFAQSVDWAASAITDFMYLDLILARDQTPGLAAQQLAALIPFSQGKVEGGPFDSVSFRLLPAPPTR